MSVPALTSLLRAEPSRQPAGAPWRPTKRLYPSPAPPPYPHLSGEGEQGSPKSQCSPCPSWFCSKRGSGCSWGSKVTGNECRKGSTEVRGAAGWFPVCRQLWPAQDWPNFLPSPSSRAGLPLTCHWKQRVCPHVEALTPPLCPQSFWCTNLGCLPQSDPLKFLPNSSDNCMLRGDENKVAFLFTVKDI